MILKSKLDLEWRAIAEFFVSCSCPTYRQAMITSECNLQVSTCVLACRRQDPISSRSASLLLPQFPHHPPPKACFERLDAMLQRSLRPFHMIVPQRLAGRPPRRRASAFIDAIPCAGLVFLKQVAGQLTERAAPAFGLFQVVREILMRQQHMTHQMQTDHARVRNMPPSPHRLLRHKSSPQAVPDAAGIASVAA